MWVTWHERSKGEVKEARIAVETSSIQYCPLVMMMIKVMMVMMIGKMKVMMAIMVKKMKVIIMMKMKVMMLIPLRWEKGEEPGRQQGR